MLVLAIFLAELSPFSPYLSPGNIIANMPPIYDIKATFAFHVSAFTNTQFIVQISLIAVALVLATYAYHFIQRLALRLVHSGLARQSTTS